MNQKVGGSNPRWFTNKTKTPANPCHYRAGGCLYDRAKLSKGLKSGNLGTSFRVVE